MAKSKVTSIDSKLLSILACPVAVQYKNKGKNPGKLRLYKESWLISDVSGYKYPIVEGIPIMLVDVGKKYKGVVDKDLPIPPPKPE